MNLCTTDQWLALNWYEFLYGCTAQYMLGQKVNAFKNWVLKMVGLSGKKSNVYTWQHFLTYLIYINNFLGMLFLLIMEWNIHPYKKIWRYKTITYILILAKHAYYDRFESAKQWNDLDMD